jgi:hypothetical protein
VTFNPAQPDVLASSSMDGGGLHLLTHTLDTRRRAFELRPLFAAAHAAGTVFVYRLDGSGLRTLKHSKASRQQCTQGLQHDSWSCCGCALQVAGQQGVTFMHSKPSSQY